MTENTLRITFKQDKKHRDAAREKLRRAEAGETGDELEQDVKFILNFEEFADIDQLMRTTNLKLIEAIVSQQPQSMRQAAEAVGRDYKEVHRNLKELEELGVVELVKDGKRQKPILREGADNIDFSIQFPRPDESGKVGASA